MEKTAKKFRSFAEAEKADRDFYKKLTGNVYAFWLSSKTMGLSKARESFSNYSTPAALITSSSVHTVSFRKVSAELDGIPVFVPGKEALIRNKRVVG